MRIKGQVSQIELTDDRLEMVTGGKGTPGGASLIRDGIKWIWRMIQRALPKD